MCNSGLVVGIVATPGPFLHLVVEMELRLNSIEYVVFDEAEGECEGDSGEGDG